MTLAEYLVQTLTPEELVRELVAHVKEKAALLDRVDALEYELFWMKVAERDADAP